MRSKMNRRIGAVRTEYLIAGVACIILMAIMVWALSIGANVRPHASVAKAPAASPPVSPTVAPTPAPAPTASVTPPPDPTPVQPSPPETGKLPPDWVAEDIGSPALPSAATHNDQGWVISAAGADIWASRDAFHYAYQSASGDHTWIVKVDSMANTEQWSKAGLMLRQNKSAESPHISLFVSSGVVLFCARGESAASTADWGQVPVPVPEKSNPTWLKLVRNGSSFAAYFARSEQTPADGNWTQVGSTQSINFPESYLAGLAVTAHTDAHLCTVTFGELETRQSVAIAAPTPETPPAASTAGQVILDDTFDSFKTGARPSGSEWSFDAPGGTVNVQKALGLEGMCLYFKDSSRTAAVFAKRTFASQSAPFSIEFKLRFSQITDGSGVALLLGDKVVARVETRGRELVAWKDKDNWQTLEKIRESTWYTLRLDVIPKEAAYEVFIDEQKKGDRIPFAEKVDAIDAWCAGTSPQQTGGFYLKSVKIITR